MANRIIYNAQDLFFGLASGAVNSPPVTGHLSDGGTGIFEVLKRIHRVQNFGYDIVTNREDVGLLGKSAYNSHTLSSPPDVKGTISYYLEGLNNEKKMGFNVLTDGSSNVPNKEFTYNFLSGNKNQNIYLSVDDDGADARDLRASPSEIAGIINSGTAKDAMRATNVNKLGLLVFQNAYIDNYSLDITVGSYPKVDVSFVADNAIFLSGASGLNTPYINTQDATVSYGEKEIILPKNYKRENPYFDVNHTFRPGDVSVEISRRGTKEDIIFEQDMESSEVFQRYGLATHSLTSSQQYQGLQSLEVTSNAALVGSNYGGVFAIPAELRTKMSAGEYYTVQYAIKVSSMDPNGKLIRFSHQNGQGDNSTLSHSDFYKNEWTFVNRRVKLDAVKNNIYFWSVDPNLTFWIDSFKIFKDAENEPIAFYRDTFQSVKLNIPMNRQNISCVGHKYYTDRALNIPLKTSITLDMLESGANFQESGNFLDNLRRDEEYDMAITFVDSQGEQGMKFNIFGAKFDGVSYNSDIGSNKTASSSFTLSNDYDYARNIITADGKGLFVLDYLVDDNLTLLTDDDGNYFHDPHPHLF
tara:strand:- start:194 stop:1942 length:1749 start_codon:yes stop_codon:yes gene_type:complete